MSVFPGGREQDLRVLVRLLLVLLEVRVDMVGHFAAPPMREFIVVLREQSMRDACYSLELFISPRSTFGRVEHLDKGTGYGVAGHREMVKDFLRETKDERRGRMKENEAELETA